LKIDGFWGSLGSHLQSKPVHSGNAWTAVLYPCMLLTLGLKIATEIFPGTFNLQSSIHAVNFNSLSLGRISWVHGLNNFDQPCTHEFHTHMHLSSGMPMHVADSWIEDCYRDLPRNLQSSIFNPCN